MDNNIFKTLKSIESMQTLYDYVVHIQPDSEIGYFVNGTGCLTVSNMHLDNMTHCSTSTCQRFKYPIDANDEITLKYFCFPEYQQQLDSSLLTRKQIVSEYFRFTLTDAHGRRQYGYCSRFVRKNILNALCLISPFDLMDFYEKILHTATELFIAYKDNDARRFLIEIYPHRLPIRGDTIYISTTTVGLYTLQYDYDRRKALIDTVTLLRLSTGNTND
jgi:hypothetical protein